MIETTIFQDSLGDKFEYDTYGPETGYPVLYMHPTGEQRWHLPHECSA